MRIGIIGTGRISKRFSEDCKHVKENIAQIELVVFNPHIESARKFSVEHEIQKYTDDWDEFLTMIDAGYVGAPHHSHVMYSRKLLEAGKHVLCEKPMAISENEAKELFALAEKKNLVLMEAMKTAYAPGFIALCDMVKSGKIGTVVDVEAAFTRLTPVNCREYQDSEYGGSFTEFGSYPLLPILKLLGTDYKAVSFKSIKEANGVDSYTKAFIDYGEKMATCKVGLGVKSEGQLLISGTNGYIIVPSPWWLTKSFQVRYEDPNRIENYEYPFEYYGLIYEIEEFCCRVSGKNTTTKESLLAEEKEALARAQIMEKFLKESGRDLGKKEITNSTCNGDGKEVRIWAHRGCSMTMPENTIPAFVAAAGIPGITGIEFDVQFSFDGEIVVIHDETVDRTTVRNGNVRDYTLRELQDMELAIKDEDKAAGRFNTKDYHIPSLREVFDALAPYCRDNDLMLNIEFKTSVIRYEGIEKKVYDMVREYDDYNLSENIVYSSFLADSIKVIKEIDPKVKTGMLAGKLTDCLRMGKEVNADAWHPEIRWLQHGDNSNLEGKPVRAWNVCEPLYNTDRVYTGEDLRKYTCFGVTDLFTNEPERYL
ncbi:MAG: Gfo/Idh/MocA family oxidoreductase [Butyrivibrio sp.]|nr:Gfo/Idh/MocA family oxidoreductase [Butyrivibrio sp.]